LLWATPMLLLPLLLLNLRTSLSLKSINVGSR